MATKTVRVPIEVDITYANRTWFKHQKKKADQKAYIIGFYQRSEPCQAIIEVLPDNKEKSILKILSERVAPGSMVYCEAGNLPESVKGLYEVHEIPEGSHAVGDLHVNNVKTMWRALKRDIKEEHISVSFEHLPSYCGLVAWRTNNAHLNNAQRFDAMLSLTAKNGHLKYSELIQRGKKRTTKKVVK